MIALTSLIGGVVAVAITGGVLYVLERRNRGAALPVAITARLSAGEHP